jgi:hypothetical protein
MPTEGDASCGSSNKFVRRSENEQDDADFLESICLPCANKAKTAGMDELVSLHQDGRREICFEASPFSPGSGKDDVGVAMTPSVQQADDGKRDDNGAKASGLEAMTPETITSSRILTTKKIPKRILNVAASAGEPTGEKQVPIERSAPWYDAQGSPQCS